MCRREKKSAAGLSALELLVVMALGALLVAGTLPAMQAAYARHQADYSALQVRSLVSEARIAAIKEKTRYRVVLHDANDATPNRIEVQREQGGNFVTVPELTHALVGGVSIEDGSSMSRIVIGTRGECSSGYVHLTSHGAITRSVSVSTSCVMTHG